MIPFPKIGQFRDTLKKLKRMNRDGGPLPVLNFRGTVKLHGTHCDIVQRPDGTYQYQSRNRVLTKDDDMLNFAKSMGELDLSPLFNTVRERRSDPDSTVVLTCELCGENIQKGVAITGLPRFVMIYGIRVIDMKTEEELEVGERNSDEKLILWNSDTWLDMADYQDVELPDLRIFNIMKFPTYSVTVDFNNTHTVQNTLVGYVEEVEKECPVAKAMGSVGTGEGLVWSTYPDVDLRLFFKTKGAKHSVTKVKTLVEIDPEVISSVKEFADRTVTENRLQQGVQYLEEQGIEVDRKNTGKFIKWILSDIMKEEGDLLDSNIKKLAIREIQSRASHWFIELA